MPQSMISAKKWDNVERRAGFGQVRVRNVQMALQYFQYKMSNDVPDAL